MMVSSEEKLKDQLTLKWLKTVALNDFLAVGIFYPIILKIIDGSNIHAVSFEKIWTICNYAQLLGGFVYGVMIDDVSSKRTLIALTAVLTIGAFIAVVLTNDFVVLATSCIVLAFVKQTLIVVTTSITEVTVCNNSFSRFVQLGQLSAISILCGFVNQPLSAFLRAIHAQLPLLVAVSLLLRNVYISSVLLPPGRSLSVVAEKHGAAPPSNVPFYRVLLRPSVSCSILLKLGIMLVESATSTTNVPDYYKQRFGVKSLFVSLWSGFGATVGVIVNWFFIGKAIRYFGGEARTIEVCLSVLALTQAIEHFWPASLSFFLFVFSSMVPSVVSSTIMTQSSNLLLTQLVPIHHVGKLFGILNVLMTVVGRAAPQYGSYIHSYLLARSGGWNQRAAVAGGHFLLLAIFVATIRAAGVLPKRHTTALSQSNNNSISSSSSLEDGAGGCSTMSSSTEQVDVIDSPDEYGAKKSD